MTHLEPYEIIKKILTSDVEPRTSYRMILIALTVTANPDTSNISLSRLSKLTGLSKGRLCKMRNELVDSGLLTIIPSNKLLKDYQINLSNL